MTKYQWNNGHNTFKPFFRSSESHTDTPVSDSSGDDTLFNELNVPIIYHEVRVALSSLKSRKASGHGNVTAKMLKASDNIAVTFFTKLLNKFFFFFFFVVLLLLFFVFFFSAKGVIQSNGLVL